MHCFIIFLHTVSVEVVVVNERIFAGDLREVIIRKHSVAGHCCHTAIGFVGDALSKVGAFD